MPEEERIYDGTIMETNGWFLVDEYSYEYARKIGEHTYEFISYLWLPSDEEDPDKSFIIQIDEINLSDYTEYDLECYVSSRYDSIAAIREEYEKPLSDEDKELLEILGCQEIERQPWTQEDTEEAIAECVFDESYACAEEYGFVTEEEAQKIIVNYIRNN